MRKLITCIGILAFMLIGTNNAEAIFSVNWGNSWDWDYSPGYVFLGRWLYNNYYFSDLGTATNFAQNNYIGHKESESDPFYFKPGSYDISIVYENAGYSDINQLGYYIDPVSGKALIFSGTESGPITLKINEFFGFYLHTDYADGPYWFTDRFVQGGQPQGLIYKLDSKKWLIAWEDLDSTGWSDNDYNDMYVLIEKNIPEPSSIFLFGSGMLGWMGLRKRKHS